MSRIGVVSGLVYAALLCACDSSTPYNPGECNPAKQPCACSPASGCPPGFGCVGNVCRSLSDLRVEGGVRDGVPDQPRSDLPAGKDFGEACTDKLQCKSHICLFAGIGGICTRTCTAGTCPPGYGCIGVLDAIDPGKVTEVCVPETTQLCTLCTKDTECSLSGADLCLPAADGLAFCGRDCSKMSCPKGYSCGSLTVGGKAVKQCQPDSGSCDCDATKVGTKKVCTISTTFGNCQGSKTCSASGWGSCDPPSITDPPDGAYKDDNCDGIDGELTAGVFVATATGSDTTTCGDGPSTPCKTIGAGIKRAVALTRSWVYIQAGDYGEVVVLADGVHLVGGYSTAWKRDTRTKAAHKVTITGALDKDEDQYLTVRAHNLAQPTLIVDLFLVGPDASGTTTAGTRSSQIIHSETVAGLKLERVSLVAGNGAGGAPGSDGQSAPTVSPVSSMSGGTGGPASEGFSTCNATARGAGGKAGTNSCAAGASPTAGAGGLGGTKDTCCDCVLGICTCLTCGCTATSGATGGNAAQVAAGSYGSGGTGGAGASTCLPGGKGKAGRVQNGPAGPKGSGGRLVGSYWYANNGGAGGLGQHGGGGGGGGGSGGCDAGTDSTGAGGGGGGAGGCAAVKAGNGGAGGGGSFAILAIASTVKITDCEVQLGQGGSGGAGGLGGRGQSGGPGAFGGAGGTGAGAGGDAGSGGHGGHGGGGGGGAGGGAYGVFSYMSNISQSCTFTGGASGSGGKGGASAPSAPTAERDGYAGGDGDTAPSAANVATCTSASSCW